MNLRDLLLEYQWNSKKIPDVKYIQISFIHRGAPKDEKIIQYEDIFEIKKKFFVIKVDNISNYIPFHRIKKIINSNTHKVLYQKKPKNLFDREA